MNQTKIYVGNLSYDTTEAGLQETFGAYGDITDCKLITDRATGRSKGFAFITFEKPEAANDALKLDGTDLDGRPIRVNLAREDRDRGGRPGGHGGGFGGGRGGYRG